MQTLTVTVSEETAQTLNAWAKAESREPGELAGEKLEIAVAADARRQREEILARLPDTRWEDEKFVYDPPKTIPDWVEILVARAAPIRSLHQSIDTEQTDAEFAEQLREIL